MALSAKAPRREEPIFLVDDKEGEEVVGVCTFQNCLIVATTKGVYQFPKQEWERQIY